MKNSYSKFFIAVGTFILMNLPGFNTANAQCPYGFPSGTTLYDTTINTPPGINTLQVKVP